MTEFKHIPVLLNEVIENLNIKSDGIYVDLTIGRAGHSSEILKRIPKGFLYGFDQDASAIKESNERLASIGSNYKLIHKNFISLYEVMNDENMVGKVNGILIDLGVSSPQFDDESRGFSYQHNSSLDMRMDQRQSFTAKDIVNKYSLDDLVRIFKEYSDEKYAYSIAKNIVKARETKEIETTYELVDIIKKSKPMKELKKEGHPAKQVFQALRIETNDEINVLKEVLNQALKVLAPEGRLAIISFHSGEDRIVKLFFRDQTTIIGNRLNVPTIEEKKDFLLITHKAITASEDELKINNRAHSAKLRVIEKKGE